MEAIVERLQSLRLTIHAESAQVQPVTTGIPWLGFVVYPSHRRLKSRKTVHATRRLSERFDAWRDGRTTFAEFDASVHGWINHVRYADTWGLQNHVLKRFSWGPEQSAAASAEKNRARPRVARPRFPTTPGHLNQ